MAAVARIAVALSTVGGGYGMTLLNVLQDWILMHDEMCKEAVRRQTKDGEPNPILERGYGT